MRQNAEIYIFKFVKSHLMPFAQGVDEARHYIEQARQEDEGKKSLILRLSKATLLVNLIPPMR